LELSDKGKHDNFLWIAMFFSIGYFLWLRIIVDWDWQYYIVGLSITVILLAVFFYGKKEIVKKKN